MNPVQCFRKLLLLLSFFLLSSVCFSQVTEQWVKRYNGACNGFDQATSMAVNADGNVYVTGYIYGDSCNTDYATIKYDVNGNELWIRRYNGSGNSDDKATSLVVDADGNVYVTGNSFGYATIKYNADGKELWVRRYNGNPFDEAPYLAVDADGHVYVTGTTYSSETGFDYVTIKYDAVGNELWVKRYNGFSYFTDIATSLAVDVFGNVYVTGSSAGNGTGFDYTTIKYDTNGAELWVKTYNGAVNGNDGATALAVDSSGNVYVTGTSWGSAGSGINFNNDYATIKYDVAGSELWVKRYDGPFISDDYAHSLAVDIDGNVYVTGWSYNSGTDDYATVKYDIDGNELWARRYNGPENGYDRANDLAIDIDGNVYVTGESNADYATIKYDVSGNEQWVKTYNGPENFRDNAQSLVVDADGNLYVTGASYGIGTKSDYATIKYTQNQAATVSSFTLINADTDEAIRELQDGDTMDLTSLPSLNLNIRANTTPTTVGSVVFALNGAETRSHTENIVPYALFADDTKGDYYSWTPKNGNYTLTATPYSAAKGNGEKGTPLTIHFTVTGIAISSLILVNAETDQDIKTLQNGDVIDLAALPTTQLNIRAVVHPDTVGSVVFNLSNRLIVRENYVPYAIGGDIKGNFRAWTLPTGHHNLTATPHDGKYGRGKKGKAHHVSFTVIDMSTITRAVNAEKPVTDAAQNTAQRLSVTPNPFADHTTIRFSVPQSGYTTVEVYDMKGIALQRLYQAQAEAGKVYGVRFDSKQLPGGVYVLKVVTDKHIRSYKLVVIR